MLSLPKRHKNPMAKRHQHFVCIAAANTYGNGADRQFCGRNQQDGAFLARFRSITVDYDRDLETKLCPDKDLRELCWTWRKNAAEARLERVISTREVIWAYRLRHEAKADNAFIVESISDGWRDEEKRKVFGSVPTGNGAKVTAGAVLTNG
jgi:cobaltochelatase CobS